MASTICRGGAIAHSGGHARRLCDATQIWLIAIMCFVCFLSQLQCCKRPRCRPHDHGSARRNIPTSLFRHAEALPRSRFGTPKHPHEPVLVGVQRAERRAEPCVRRAEATQSAETSFTTVSACTAFRRRTSAEICNGVPNSRRTGASAPNRRRNGTPERRKTACFGAETAKMPRFSAPKISLKPPVVCTESVSFRRALRRLSRPSRHADSI